VGIFVVEIQLFIHWGNYFGGYCREGKWEIIILWWNLMVCMKAQFEEANPKTWSEQTQWYLARGHSGIWSGRSHPRKQRRQTDNDCGRKHEGIAA